MAAGLEAYLVVLAGSVRCAIPLERVRHVARAMTVWPVPGSAPELAGLGQFGGEPIVVLDLLRLLEPDHGLEAGDGEGVVVLVSAGGEGGSEELVGLAASYAMDIVRVPHQAVVRTGRGLTPGELALGDHLVRVVDPLALAAP